MTYKCMVCDKYYKIGDNRSFRSRKAQNLTLPGNSDGGSSGSGQSSTSSHPGSPPRPISSSKRPGFQERPYGLTKRQRTSHNIKIDPMLDDERPLSDDEYLNRKRSCELAMKREKALFRPNSPPIINKTLMNDSRKDILVDRTNVMINGLNGRKRQEDKKREKLKCNKASSSQSAVARVSHDSQTEGLAQPELDPSSSKIELDYVFPDYKLQYTTIQDHDQRRQYKNDFNTEYEEYRRLHAVIEKVAGRFIHLEEWLKQEEGNSTRIKDIKRLIVQEYHDTIKNSKYQYAKERFKYLHARLSHIKDLVTAYDDNLRKGRY